MTIQVLIPYETGQSWDVLGVQPDGPRLVLIPYETGQSWDAQHCIARAMSIVLIPYETGQSWDSSRKKSACKSSAYKARKADRFLIKKLFKI